MVFNPFFAQGRKTRGVSSESLWVCGAGGSFGFKTSAGTAPGTPGKEHWKGCKSLGKGDLVGVVGSYKPLWPRAHCQPRS